MENLLNRTFKKRIQSLILLSISLIIVSCNKKEISDTASLFYNATIIDVTDGRLDLNQAILIDQGKIQSIGMYKDLKDQCLPEKQYDLEGKYIIPGLWDSHVHIDKLSKDYNHSLDMLNLYTLFGVTSIREMGGDWKKLKKMKEAANSSNVLPTVYTAGPIFEDKDWVERVVQLDNDIEFGKQRIKVSKAEEVPFLVDSVVKLGVDFIKVRTAASREVFFELAKQCKKHNIKLAGHVDFKIDLYDAVKSGTSSLEHVDIFQLSGMQESKMDSIVELMNDLKTAYAPTLIYFKQHRINDKKEVKSFLYDSTYTDHPNRAYASKSLLDKSKQAFGWAEDSPIPWQEMEANFLQFGKKIAKQNGLMLASTDGANALVLPGLSLHKELKLMQQEFDMDNLSVLQAATLNPTKYFGFGNQGTIEEQNIADLVILDKNPLEDIENISSIYGVVKSGNYIDKETIQSKLENIKQYNKSQN